MTWGLVNLVGAGASVVGALVSVVNAGRAKKFSRKAEEQISQKRQLTDIATIEAGWRELYLQLAPFGPSASLESLRGKSPARASRLAQDFIEEVKSRSDSVAGVPMLHRRLKEIGTAISDFAEATGVETLKSTGTRLLRLLGDLNSALTSLRIVQDEKVAL